MYSYSRTRRVPAGRGAALHPGIYRLCSDNWREPVIYGEFSL
jgi:hypothetical protein